MWRVWRRGEVNTGFWCRKPEGKSPLEDRSIDGSIILRWMFMKWYMFAWMGLIWLMIERDGGLLKESNEPSVSTK
jgi:hypothetical protein